jgi:hypothetical protein
MKSVYVFVGDFDQTVVSKETLKAYGLKRWPPNRRSSSQRRAGEKLAAYILAAQYHQYVTGGSGPENA